MPGINNGSDFLMWALTWPALTNAPSLSAPPHKWGGKFIFTGSPGTGPASSEHDLAKVRFHGQTWHGPRKHVGMVLRPQGVIASDRHCVENEL